METIENVTIAGQIRTQPISIPLSTVQRVAITTARYLVDFLMTKGGLNAFLDYAYHPLATLLLARQYMEYLLNSPYIVRVIPLQAVAGVMLAVKYLISFALIILATIRLNILLYPAILEAEGSGAAIVVCLLWMIVLMGDRTSLCGLSKV